MADLSFAWLYRAGSGPSGKSGGSKTERRSLDFVVDGQSLYELTRASDLDLFGLLGWCSEQVEQESVRQLLLEEPTTLPGNRQSIFVCAECGDIGCGAITARIEQRGGMFIWTEFAYENDYDPEMTDRESYQRLGPFRFDADSYRTALAAAPTTPRT